MFNIFEDSVCGQNCRRRVQMALGDVCPVTVYLVRRGNVRLSHLIVSGLVSLVSSFSINIVDLLCQKNDRSNGILSEWQNARRQVIYTQHRTSGRAEKVSWLYGTFGLISRAVIPLLY